MQVKLLHDLVEEMAGLDTGRIVDILFGKKDVNEFLIAKKMELTINQVRNILYKLSADGLVSFIRKKDKRKGWYIYYWTLKTEKCLVKLEGSLARKIENLNGILNSRETKRFYICKPCGIEVGEEKALEHGFSCEECAEVYELSDNSGPIRDTKAKVTRTEKELELIRGELEIIREKERKKRARANKKEEKETAEKKAILKIARAEARKKVAAAKAKAEGKTVKKKAPAKKKVAAKKKAPAKKKVAAKKVVKKKVAVKKKAAPKKKAPAKKVVKKKAPAKKTSLADRLKKKLSGKK
jgi:transcription factor E